MMALAALLLIVSYHSLFLGTALGFLGSALLVVSVVLPRAILPSRQTSIRRRSANEPDRPALFAAQFSLSRMLADRLSASWLARRKRGHEFGVVGHGGIGPARCDSGAIGVAGEGPGCDCPLPRRTAIRSSHLRAGASANGGGHVASLRDR